MTDTALIPTNMQKYSIKTGNSSEVRSIPVGTLFGVGHSNIKESRSIWMSLGSYSLIITLFLCIWPMEGLALDSQLVEIK